MKKKLDLRVLPIPLAGKKTLLIMRLLIFLMCVFNLNVFSEINAQRVNEFRVQNANLKNCIRKVEQLTGLGFMYNGGDLEKITGIHLDVKNVEVEALLDALLEGTGFTYQLMEGIIAIRKEENVRMNLPQVVKKTVSGVVKDKAGEPLPGVAILIKGTTLGGTTDVDGKFELLVPEVKDLVLVFTFVGMKPQEVAYKGQAAINVVMEAQATEMDEVVVTGIFNKSKSNFTGAATTFTREQLQQVSSQNLLTTLSVIDPSFKLMENLEAGSNPNNLPEFEIRGSSNIAGLESEYKDNPNEPTFILDGFEVNKEKIFDLDPDRVESMTILKDAAATAIYGSRAANGVVVVETKAPAMGELRVSYNFTLDMEAADLSVYHLLNASEKLEYERLAKLYTHSNVEVQERLLQKYNDRREMVAKGYDVDWLSQPIRDLGVGHRHSLMLDGGNKGFRYGVSLNYHNKAGAMIDSKRNTLGIGINLQYNYKNLKFLNNLTYETVRSSESPYGSFSQYAQMNPYFYPWDEQGNVVEMIYEPDKILNPLYNATLNTKDERKYDNFTNNFSVEWNITEAWRFTGKLSLNRKTELTDNFKPGQHTDFYGKDVKGSYTKATTESSYYEGASTLSYTKMLEKHLIIANLGFSIKENKSDMYRVTAAGFPNDKMDHVGMGSQFEEGTKPTGIESVSRNMGFIGNASYSYDNRYLFDASIRQDGSSQFGSEKRWGMFWSLGAGWNIHKEAFLQEQEFVTLLKLRASMGYTGSQKFNPYQALMMYRYLDYAYGDNVGAQIMAFGNNNLKWQRTDKRNIGLDFELWNKRINGSFNFYTEYSKDVLTDITLAPSLGFDTYKENLGEVRNTGYELTLQLALIRKEDKGLRWNVMGSLVHNKNELMKINNALTAYNDKVSENFNKEGDENETDAEKQKRLTSPKVKYQEGQSMNTIWCVRSLGIDPATGSEIFLDREGNKVNVYNPDDQVPYAVTDPKLEGTVGTNISYRGFQLNAYFMYKFGGYAYNQTLVDKVENVSPTSNVDYRVLYDRWQRAGDLAKFKSISDKSITKPTSRFVEKENVFECKSINLSYTFQKGLLTRMGMERLKLTFYANDIFRSSTVKQERGTVYPFARNYTFGIQATF